MTKLKTTIDSMYNSGSLSVDEYDEINHYYMAGSANMDEVRVFLNKLNRQFESVYGRTNGNPSNIRAVINRKGAITIDVGVSGNEMLVDLVVNHLMLISAQGKDFALVVDSIPMAKYEKITDLIRSHHFAISNADFVASLFGGKTEGDALFSEIMGYVSNVVVFHHDSGRSCQKWSEYFGKYRKIRIRYNISTNDAFMNSSNTRGISVDECDEPRIRAETINKLEANMACIYNAEGILIADVKD